MPYSCVSILTMNIESLYACRMYCPWHVLLQYSMHFADKPILHCLALYQRENQHCMMPQLSVIKQNDGDMMVMECLYCVMESTPDHCAFLWPYLVAETLHDSQVFECDIWLICWWNFFKFGTNIHLDQRTNWFDLCDWRPKVKLIVAY